MASLSLAAEKRKWGCSAGNVNYFALTPRLQLMGVFGSDYLLIIEKPAISPYCCVAGFHTTQGNVDGDTPLWQVQQPENLAIYPQKSTH